MIPTPRSVVLAVCVIASAAPSFAACPAYKGKNAYSSAAEAQESMERMRVRLNKTYKTNGSVLPPAAKDTTFGFQLEIEAQANGRCPAVKNVLVGDAGKTYAEAINAMSLALADEAANNGAFLAVDTFVYCKAPAAPGCGYSYAILR